MNKQFPINLLPKISKDFIDKVKNNTEAPDEFLAVVSLFLGSILSGNWVTFNNQKLNNYFLIVGKTGFARKTSALSFAFKLLQSIKSNVAELTFKYHDKAKDTLQISDAYPVATHFSIEGLHELASGVGASIALILGEYARLFNVNQRSGQKNTVTDLTDMYDSNPISHRTVSRVLNLNDYTVSLMASSTESWLNEFLSQMNVSGGFVNRHFIVVAEPVRSIPSPEEISVSTWNDIINSFVSIIPKNLHSIFGEDNRIIWNANMKKLKFDNDAKIIWERYYNFIHEQYRQITTESLLELSARENTHSIKLAGLRAHMDGRVEVSVDDITFGILAARYSTQCIFQIADINKISTKGHREKHKQKIVNLLKKKGTLTKREMAQALGGKQDQYSLALQELLMEKLISLTGTPLVYALIDQQPNIAKEEIEKFFGESIIYKIINDYLLEVGRTKVINPTDLVIEKSSIEFIESSYEH